MLYLSLVLNIVVLAPLLWALSLNSLGMSEVYGPDSPARRILGSVYLTILMMSLALLAALAFSNHDVRPYAVTLLALQVLYKITTAFVLGVAHPVVIANLAISAVHVATLVVILR